MKTRNNHIVKRKYSSLAAVLLMILQLFIGVVPVMADSTGIASPTVATGWSNPNNSKISDNVYTTGPSLGHTVTGFGFNIPTDATIDGIEVRVERKFTRPTSANAASYIADQMADLVLNGVPMWEQSATYPDYNRAVLWTQWSRNVDEIKLFGSPTDKWGKADLSPADINNPNFGFNIWAQKQGVSGTLAYIDCIVMTVYYTLPPVNIAPVTVDDTYSTPKNTPLTVPATGVPSVLANDTDIDSAVIQAVMGTAPSNGTLDNANSVAPDGSFVYTPNAGFVGTDTFTYYADDYTDNGNMATVTINVTPVDDVAPTITFPLNEVNPTIEATGSSTLFNFHPTVTDDTDPAPILTSDTPAGSVFPLGSTIVTWTATDNMGNTATATQTVTVKDTISPSITSPTNITTEATSAAGAVATFAPIATDITGTPIVTCDPVSGSTFALGTTVVTCTAEDSSGNKATATFTVTVNDTTAPSISSHANITRQATSALGSIVAFMNPTAIDLVDGNVAVTCIPPSGSTFSLGQTTVNCSAMDIRGNSSATSFIVNIIDTIPPATPVLYTPVDGAATNNTTPTLDWSSISDADKYRFQICFNDPDTDGSCTVERTITTSDNSSQRTLINSLAEGTYWWRVRAIDAVGNIGHWSQANQLTIDTTNPEAPVLISPLDGAAVSSNYPTLDWSDVSDATKYRFQICYNNPGNDVPCDEERKVTTLHNVSERTLANYLAEGDYWWRVRSIDAADNFSPWSSTFELTIDVTNPVSSVDALSQYKNTQRFDINVTSSDLMGQGDAFLFTISGTDTSLNGSEVDFVELWYRKDGSVCPATDISGLMIVPFGLVGPQMTDDCVDGFVRYENAEGVSQFEPNTPIEFDTSLTGGDGFYEFFSVAVDNAGNAEDYPVSVVNNSLVRLNIEESEEDSNVVADTSTTVDTVAPVITLNGDAIVSITQDQLYADLGAITDDGSTVIVTGTVNTAVPGIYLLKYNAIDLAGNVATEVIRKVIVNSPSDVLGSSSPASNGGQILGGQTTTSPGVLGSDTNGDANNDDGNTPSDTENSSDGNTGWNIFGLAWYWWLLILAVISGIIWWFVAGRKLNDEQ